MRFHGKAGQHPTPESLREYPRRSECDQPGVPSLDEPSHGCREAGKRRETGGEASHRNSAGEPSQFPRIEEGIPDPSTSRQRIARARRPTRFETRWPTPWPLISQANAGNDNSRTGTAYTGANARPEAAPASKAAVLLSPRFRRTHDPMDCTCQFKASLSGSPCQRARGANGRCHGARNRLSFHVMQHWQHWQH